MSEQEQERPLTRRELREREQAAQQSPSTGEAELAAEEQALAEQTEATQATDVHIEIDPLNPDGTPRTRREMRELREVALAELESARAVGDTDGSEAPTEGDSDTPVEADSEDVQEATASIESDVEVDASEDDMLVVDDEYGPPTEAFSLDDLLDASEPTAPTGGTDAVAALFAEAYESVQEEPEAHEGQAESGGVEEGADVDVDVDVDEAGDDGTDDSAAFDVEDLAPPKSDDPHGLDAVFGAPDADPLEVEPEFAEDLPTAGPTPVFAEKFTADPVSDDEDTPELKTETAAYSFPDIKPPEEWRSVFDDPGRAAAIVTPDSSGDFDDLISRAVAQEGSTEGTGDSALILPTHPGDTGGLSGPLGVTGELFVTGSIELPKSLGETGGHAALQDSVGFDPFLPADSVAPMETAADGGSGPVPALRAVSARRRPEMPVIAEPTKDKSKLPLILAVSGGTLIVILAGVVIYAATQGLFG